MVLVVWMNRVVPFAMKVVGLQIDMGKLFIRDLSPNGVLAVIPGGRSLSSPWPSSSRRSAAPPSRNRAGELTTGELSRVREAGNRLSRAGGLQRGPASLSFHSRSRTRTRARRQRGGLEEVATPYHKIYSILLGCLWMLRSEEHTSELQSLRHLVCR